MDLLEPLAQTFDHTTKVLSGIAPDQLDAPTPCTAWRVRDVVGHVLAVNVNMARCARGEASVPGPLDLEADLGAQFRAIADATLAAWTARGSDGDVNFGAGTMPAITGLSIDLIDTAAHSWDIATATGQDGQLPDDVAALALDLSRRVLTDEIRTEARFAPPNPIGDASPTDRLVAFLGRQP